MYIGIYVKCPLFLSDFIQTSTYFREKKRPQTRNFIKIHHVEAELFHADRGTDRHDKVNSRFSQFCESV